MDKIVQSSRIPLVFLILLASFILPLKPAYASQAKEVTAPPTEVTLYNGYKIVFKGVNYNGNNTSTWQYSVVRQFGDYKLNNWILEIPCDGVTSATPDTWSVVNPDSKTGISGIRWDVPGNFTSGQFSVTVQGYRLTGTNQVAAKSTSLIVTGRIAGPSCAVNQPPQAEDIRVSTTQGNNITIPVLNYVQDPDGDVIYLTDFQTASSQGGAIARQDMGTPGDTTDDRLLYTAPANYIGEDRFSYLVSDSLQSTTAWVIVQVGWNGQAPITNPDTYTVNSVTISVASPGVLENDSLPTGLVWEAVQVSPTSRGSLSLQKDGSFTYTPEAGFAGNDSFSYRAKSGTIESSPATVTLRVPDQIPPTVTWLQPTTAGLRYDVLDGQIVTLEVQAVDNQGIDSVKFIRWDAVKGNYVTIAELKQAPYQAQVNTTEDLNPEWNQIYVVVHDTSGNRAEDQYIWLYKTIGTGGNALKFYLPIVPVGG